MNRPGHDSGLRLIRLPNSAKRPPAGPLPALDLTSNDPLPNNLLGGLAAAQQPGVVMTDGGKAPAAERFSLGGEIWLEGDAIMIPCPDCRAPMSTRLWLMVADCWRCGTSIELSEEQEREVERLLAHREQLQRQAASLPNPATPTPGARPPGTAPPDATRPSKTAPAASTAVAPSAKIAPTPPPPLPSAPSQTAPPRGRSAVPTKSAVGATQPTALRPPPRPQRPAETPKRPAPAASPVSRPQTARRPAGARHRIQRLATSRSPSAWLRRLLREMPAWLVSLVFHLVLITLLGIFGIEAKREKPMIVLAAEIGHHDDGGHLPAKLVVDDVTFDLPVPNAEELKSDQQRAAMILADQAARELRLDPNDPTPNLPELARVKEVLGTSDAPRRMIAARDPRVRVELVTHEGGTTQTEAAVARALRWMSQHQSSDGSWSLHRFHQAGECSGRCRGAGNINCDSAGTSLVLLPFLGAGQTHLQGQYRDQVSRGLRWLIERQKLDGDLRAGTTSNAGMYAHGQAAIVLCEAFAMTGDEALREPAQQAIEFIQDAQYSDGGWRYSPAGAGGQQQGDTSVLGWQIMALQSARAAGLRVKPATLEQAGHYLDVAARNSGAEYSYTRTTRGATETMSAEGLLCRMYLGWTREQDGLVRGIDLLANKHLPIKSKPNIYYWYYATQVMHHAGGDPWERWNLAMRDILVDSQVTKGHEAGSWSPSHDRHDASGGRLYVTALSACTLEVYYRHAPIFRQINLE